MNDELKPCPFCGGDVECIEMGGHSWNVSCKNPRCIGHNINLFSSEQAARDAWDRRATPDIVFCRDCNQSAEIDGVSVKCLKRMTVVRAHDFCSYGKRKEKP